MKFPDHGLVRNIIRHAVREDVGSGDVTTNAAIPFTQRAKAVIVAREKFLLAGVDVARLVYKEIDGWLNFEALVEDGTWVKKGQPIVRVHGRAGSILTGERLALNFLQRLSGIATRTREYVEAVKKAVGPDGKVPQVLDTRKTTPGLRVLEKYAVLVGGGFNHRFGLYDQALFKDNHLKLMRAQGNDALAKAVATIRERHPRMLIEIEAETLADVEAALAVSPHIIMLDNMAVATMKKAVKLIAGRALVEASGGVNLQNIAAIARTGVDYISVGELTHSVRAVDMALEIEEV